MVSQYGPKGSGSAGSPTLPKGSLSEPHGVASGLSGDVYVADTEDGRVDVFGPGAVVPDVSSEKASKVARTSAILNGVVNGEGAAASTGSNGARAKRWARAPRPRALARGKKKYRRR